MSKKKTIRRLIATGAMTAFTAASLVTTSYAFVTLNTEATISQFSFDIVDQEGLLLSTDGNNFFQDIDASTIRSAILANNPATSYEALSLRGVTLGGANYVTTTDTVDSTNYTNYYITKNNGTTYVTPTSYDSTATYYEISGYSDGLYEQEYSYQIGNTGPTIADKKISFVKDSVTWYDTTDTAITSSTNTTITNLATTNDRIGLHEYVAADSTDYIFFDLWLRVAQTGDNHPNYTLKFSNKTSISGEDNEVELYNTLYVPDAKDARTYTTYDGNAVTKGKYLAGEKITVNPANAMRLGVNVLSAASTNQDSGSIEATYATGDGLTIFEPNEGLGSYAVGDGTVTGFTDDIYKPSLNPMYTYFNSINPLAPYLAGVSDNGQLTTEDDVTSKTLATFTYDSTSESYNVVKMSVMIWLEGWDADYFAGINNSNIAVKLGFVIE